MSWAAVAKKDFQDALRSRALWGISVLFVLLSVLTAYAYASFPDQLGIGETTGKGLAFFLASNITLFVSITAIVIAYKSIAGERESGSIKLLLALPHTRGEVVAGKVLGRSGVLSIPVVLGLLIGGLVGSAIIGSFDLTALGLLLGVSILFALVYISVVVGLSATTGSTTRASVLTIGFFFVFELFWSVATLGIVYVGNGFSLPQTTAQYPDWVFLVNQIPPSSAYVTTLNAVTPGSTAITTGTGPGAESIDAIYATPWIGVVMLAIWLVVPLVIGYWRFRSTDL